MKKVGISLLLLIVLAGGGYYYFFDQLGGNNPIQLSLVEKVPEALAGKTFRGIPQDEKLAETFEEIESLKSLHAGAKIHTIYYVEPAGKLDTLHVFVGINLPFPTGDLEGISFSETKYILASISGNSWIMPGPEKVKGKIREFSKEKGLELSGIFIDRIVSEKEVQVIAPVK